VPFELGLHGGHQARPELVDLGTHGLNTILPLDRHRFVAANRTVGHEVRIGVRVGKLEDVQTKRINIPP
jgi:hypothetical protein